jgi:ELWxxDGT repeat protein
MHLLSYRVLVPCLAAALGVALPAQSLLKDIDPSPTAPGKGARPGNFARVGTTTFFVADDVRAGRELFASDGTAAGTRLVKDTVPGLLPQQIGEPVALGNLLLFRAYDPRSGFDRLWRSDGTAAGTFVLSSTAEGPVGMVEFGTVVLFAAFTPATGLELWTSDGTVAGTSMLLDLRPGPDSGSDLYFVPQEAWPTRIGGEIWFVGNDGTTGFELWRTDGTAAGTQLAVDLNLSGDSNVSAIAGLGAQVVFAADDGATGMELWTIGTSGATLLLDVNPSGSSYPRQLTEGGGLLYFVAEDGVSGAELWVTDGAASTQLVADLNPGPVGAFPAFPGPQIVSSVAGVVFLGDNGLTGQEPWLVNGTAAPVLLADLWPGTVGGAVELVVDAAGVPYLAADNGIAGLELWMIAGGTPVLLADLQPGPGSGNPTGLRAFGTELWFAADDGVHGAQPFVLDASGVRMVRDLGLGTTVGGGSGPEWVGRIEQTALFVATDPVGGRELWRSDGSAAGTVRVKDLAVGGADSGPDNLVVVRGVAYFSAASAAGDNELYRSDGTAAGTYRLADLWPGGSSSFPHGLVPFGNGFAFSATHPTAGTELWFSDGTALGTRIVDLVPGAVGSDPYAMLAAGSLLFGVLYDPVVGGSELFVSDGTTAGSSTIPFPGGAGTGGPELHVALGARVLFSASDPTSGREVWISDGTVAGTTLLVDANPGIGDCLANSFVRFGNRVFYACDNGTQGMELWVTDGTPAGTSLFLDIAPGLNGSRPSSFTVAADRLYFVADDGVHGFELWVSDGTVGGTQMVRDIMVGPGSGVPYDSVLTVGADRVVVFSGDSAANGLEPWRSDGTAAGTVQLADLTPGPASSSVSRYLRAGNRVYFTNYDPSTGEEPWSLPVSATGAAVADPFGVPCPGLLPAEATAVGTPRVGNGSFAFGLSGAAPGSLSLLVLGDARGTLPLGLCSLYPSGNVGTASAVVTAAGTASVPFPLPSTASLVGFQLTSQWVVVTPGGPLLGFLLPSAGLYVVLGS